MEKAKFTEENLQGIGHDIGYNVGKFIAKLATESERSAIILGAAKLDQALENLLKKVLNCNLGGADNLFDQDRPLASFAVKISLCHRLGIIDNDFEHALQMIRKVRNDFAHSIETESIEELKHRNRLSEAIKVALKHPMVSAFNDPFKDIVSKELHNYCLLIAVLIFSIEIIAIWSSRVQVNYIASFNRETWERNIKNLAK